MIALQSYDPLHYGVLSSDDICLVIISQAGGCFNKNKLASSVNLYRFTHFLDFPFGAIFANLLVGAASPIPFERYLRYRLRIHSERFSYRQQKRNATTDTLLTSKSCGIFLYRTVFFSCSFFLSMLRIVSTVCFAISNSSFSFRT